MTKACIVVGVVLAVGLLVVWLRHLALKDFLNRKHDE